MIISWNYGLKLVDMYHISPNNYPDQITILVIKQAKFEETQGPKISMFEGGKNKKKSF